MVMHVLALVLCFATIAGAQPDVPATPAGRVFSSWLPALNSADSTALRAFDAAHRPDAPPVSQSLRFRSDTGGFALLRIEKSTPTQLVALLEERESRRLDRLELEVTTDSQPVVVSSTLRRAPRPADLPLVRLSESEALAALAVRVDELAKLDQFSGAVLVGRRGKILWQQAVGLANRENGQDARHAVQKRIDEQDVLDGGR